MLEDKLLHGNSNCAGELGHMVVSIPGRLCTCGGYGCLESLAGGWAIAEMAKERMNRAYISAKEVLTMAQQGNQLAQEIAATALQALVAGIVTIVNALNPQRILLGGGIIAGNPSWVDQINDRVKKLALKAATEHVEISKSILGADAGMIGAALYISR